jgi:hypothetical protein
MIALKTVMTGITCGLLLLGSQLATAKPERAEERAYKQGKKEHQHRRFYNDDGRRYYHGEKKRYKAKHFKHGHPHYYNHDRRWSTKRHKKHHHKKYHHYHPHHYHTHHHGPRYGFGYWRDHKRYGYRHKFYNNHHYYYNHSGFYFPGRGHIKHGHRHHDDCPDWHYDALVAGVILSAIINH